MKILLDAMMAEEISEYLTGHEVHHVADLGWRQLSNGALLTASESGGFDVLITKDANMPYQQNLEGRKIALVVLHPDSQSLPALLSLSPAILRALSTIKPGTVASISSPMNSSN